MASKSLSKQQLSKQQEAEQLLNDLDSSLSPNPAPANLKGRPSASTSPQPAEGEAAEVLAFLDEITQKSAEPTKTTSSFLGEKPLSRAGTPSLRKSTERVRVGGPSAKNTDITSSPRLGPEQSSQATAGLPNSSPTLGGWGWGNVGSVWSSATAAIQQARTVVDEQVKHLPKNEQMSKWVEGGMAYAKSAQLNKIGNDFKRVGLSTLTDILNVVAPPISEHEVIQVWLSHDMRGLDGIESLTYRALARIMEQVEGGDLIVNRGEESRPKESKGHRDLNAVEGHNAAFKLAQASLEELVKKNTKPKPQPTAASPTTYSDVYLRVQPYLTSIKPDSDDEDEEEEEEEEDDEDEPDHVQFILYLSDPGHQLIHTTVTQAVPAKWLSLWDKFDWVEDLIAESIRVGVEVVGQEYVVSRMGWIPKEVEEEKESGDEIGGAGVEVKLDEAKEEVTGKTSAK